MSKINDLENKIMYYAQLYYDGKSTITDEEFDKLVDELKELDPNNVILHSTGWGYKVPDDERKVDHPMVNVGGLSKVKTTDDAHVSFRSATPKFDGASVELVYANNKLVSAITRGDGRTGQRVTDHLIPIVGTELVKSNIESNDLLEWLKSVKISISGEFILSNESFKKNYPNEISYRNIPSGFLNRKEVTPEECRRFSFMPYRINAIQSSDYSLISKINKRLSLQFVLNTLFGVSVPFLFYEYQEQFEYRELMEYFTQNSDYNFDGIVVNNQDQFSVVQEFNTNTHVSTAVFKYDEVAYKTVTETADVIVDNINWNLTRTGRYVPVLHYNPVELSGAKCENATGHNAAKVFDNGVNIGSKIRITRSGEVIPHVIEVLEPVFENKDYYCPSCGTKLVMNGVDLVCPNNDCESKSFNRIYQWISYIGFVKNAGRSLYNAMINYANIRKVEDFYKDTDWSGIIQLDGMGESKLKLVNKIINQIHKPQKFRWMISGSNIKSISEVTAKKLELYTNLQDCLKNNTPDKLSLVNAKGVDQAVRSAIINNWDILLDNYNIVDKYCGWLVEDDVIENNSNKLKICVTGKLSCGTRGVFFEKYRDKVVETDIKNCDYLLTNNPNSGSSKNKTAIDLGKSVIGEEEFCKMIGVDIL